MRKSWRAVGLLMIASIVPFSGWRQASADVPDPIQLPAAATDQTPMTSAYSALNVPALAAGGYYQDPRTQVKVYKLTSATFPTTGFSWGHAYSEGGDEVSLPYNGSTRTIHLTTIDGFHWLIDFNPSTGVSNWRKLTGTISPWTDLAFAFSNNPATPKYAYIAGWDGAIHQVDFTTCTQTQPCTSISGNGWPLEDDQIYRPSWMHQSKNDGLFVWMRGNTDVVVAYHPASGTRKTYNECAINEPRIDREGRYIGLTMDDPQNGIVVLDFGSADPPDRYAPMTVVQRADGTVPFAHVPSRRNRCNRQILPKRFGSPRRYLLSPQHIPRGDDSPVLAIRYISGVLKITQDLGKHQTVLYQEPGEFRNRWLDFKFQTRFSPGENGRIKGRLGDKQVVDYTGVTANPENAATGYPSPSRFYFKMGLYRNVMTEPMTIYIDEYRKKQLPASSF